MRSCGFGKTGTTELGGRFGDVKGGNFGLEQVAPFVLFNGHAVGRCPVGKNLGTPQVRVENRVWMEDVYANVVRCPFESGHPGKLSKGGLGCGIGSCSRTWCRNVFGADDEDATTVRSLPEKWVGQTKEELVGIEVDRESALPQLVFQFG